MGRAPALGGLTDTGLSGYAGNHYQHHGAA